MTFGDALRAAQIQHRMMKVAMGMMVILEARHGINLAE